MSEAEVPVWIKYAGDLFFLILFLVVFFFFKPAAQTDADADDEFDDEIAANPLEKILVSDDIDDIDVIDDIENEDVSSAHAKSEGPS